MHAELGYEADAIQEQAVDHLHAALDDELGDELLRLLFTACHPVLPTEGRIALTLRLLGGLTTDEIARAFLVSEPTMAQRIVRAKRALSEQKVPFEVPRGAELTSRLGSVLEVIYLILLTGFLGGAISTHLRIGDPFFSHTVFPVYVALMVWGGLYLRDETVRALLPLRK